MAEHQHEEASTKSTTEHERFVPDFYGNIVRGLDTHHGAADYEAKTAAEAILGWNELRSRISYGAALTEFNFTFLLMFFHVSLVRAATVPPDTFNSPLLVIALGKYIVILLCTFAGAASGAHMNPNITLATTLIGFTTVARFLLYMVAQVLGAILGIAAARFSHGWSEVNSPEALGGCPAVPDSKTGPAIVSTACFFQFILSVIGGVAFDDRQGAIFGPIMGPMCIIAAVGVSIFAASSNTILMINWAECVAIAIVGGGRFNGSEWIAVVGPTLAAIAHAILFTSVPPSQGHGKFIPPLLRHFQRRESPAVEVKQDAPLASEA